MASKQWHGLATHRVDSGAPRAIHNECFTMHGASEGRADWEADAQVRPARPGGVATALVRSGGWELRHWSRWAVGNGPWAVGSGGPWAQAGLPPNRLIRATRQRGTVRSRYSARERKKNFSGRQGALHVRAARRAEKRASVRNAAGGAGGGVLPFAAAGGTATSRGRRASLLCSDDGGGANQQRRRA